MSQVKTKGKVNIEIYQSNTKLNRAGKPDIVYVVDAPSKDVAIKSVKRRRKHSTPLTAKVGWVYRDRLYDKENAPKSARKVWVVTKAV